MRIILKSFFIFFLFYFFSFNQYLYAGLGRDSIGAGGFKRDIEVNEIEDVEEIDKEDKKEDSEEGAIKSFELKKINPDTIGILSDQESGLGYDMWEGTKRNIIEKYLKLLPTNTQSITTIKLAKKLLLSSAQVPEDSGEKEDLLLIRINKLIQLGDLENAKLMMDAASKNEKNSEFLNKELEINLALNNFDLVCSDIKEKIKKYGGNVYWKKIQIFCHILNDEINQANLAISLIKEDKGFNDSDFITIADSLIYKEKINSSELTDLNLLNLSMTRVGKINLDTDIFYSEDPLILNLLYRLPNIPVESRIQALEKSEKLINLPVNLLEEIYNSYEPDENKLNFSLDKENLDLGPTTQAIFYQRAIQEENDENKAKIIKKALEISLSKKNYSTIVKLNLETILQIEPSNKMKWFAGTAAKALFYSKKFERAFEWYALLVNSMNDDTNLVLEFIDLWPIVELCKINEESINDNSTVSVSQNQILKSINDIKAKDKEFFFDLTGFYFLESYGVEINPNFWLINMNNQQNASNIMPDAPLLSLIDYSAKNNKVGETILLTLIAIDDNNLRNLSPFFLQIIIKSLDRIGQSKIAKDFAIETLIY